MGANEADRGSRQGLEGVFHVPLAHAGGGAVEEMIPLLDAGEDHGGGVLGARDGGEGGEGLQGLKDDGALGLGNLLRFLELPLHRR